MNVIIRELKRHPSQYLFLFLVLAGFIVAFIFAWPNIMLQRALSIFLGVVYFFWGLYHHRSSGMITVRIVLEYFFVSLFASAVLFLLAT